MLPLQVCVGSCSSKLEKMPSIPEEPEQAETEAECFTMPDFLKPLHNLDVVESKEAVLECQVAGLPYPSITWFHNGSRIDSTDDRKMMQCRAPRCLLCPLGVPPPRAGDGGTPWEEASSTQIFTSHEAGRGALYPLAGGFLPMSPCSLPDKDVHRLVFTAVSHAHAGVYKSVIANKVGKATCYAHLYVTGKQQWAALGWPLAATLPGCALGLGVGGPVVRS